MAVNIRTNKNICPNYCKKSDELILQIIIFFCSAVEKFFHVKWLTVCDFGE
jgi:hypothetical protein